MGTPDGHIETPQGTVFLDIKTIEIPCESRLLRTIREIHQRFPRKFKKKLKKYHGNNYHNWLNSPIKLIQELNADIYSYHSVDAEDELTKMLLDELNHENNKNS